MLLLTLIVGCHRAGVTARATPKGPSKWTFAIEGTAGAGFAGSRIAEQIENIVLNPCPPASPGCVRTASDTAVLLKRNHYYSWHPAVSTGLVGRLNRPSGLGAGLGAHVVFLPTSDNKTQPYPALMLHVGSSSEQVFFGLIFSPTDRVEFPNGRDTITVHRTASVPPPNFLERNVGLSGHLYMGLQLRGTRQSEQTASEASDAAANPVAQVIISNKTDSATVMKVNDLLSLDVKLLDARNGPLLGRTVTFSSTDPDVASVGPHQAIVRAHKKGSATITAAVEGRSDAINIVVQ